MDREDTEYCRIEYSCKAVHSAYKHACTYTHPDKMLLKSGPIVELGFSTKEVKATSTLTMFIEILDNYDVSSVSTTLLHAVLPQSHAMSKIFCTKKSTILSSNGTDMVVMLFATGSYFRCRAACRQRSALCC